MVAFLLVVGSGATSNSYRKLVEAVQWLDGVFTINQFQYQKTIAQS